MSEIIDPAVMTLVSTTASESVLPWSSGTTYSIGQLARLDSTNTIYESTADSNTNNNPATVPGKWSKYGPVNKQAVFDDSYRTQTTKASSLTYVISAAAFTDRVALLNLTGTAVQVVASKGAIELYNRTFSLLNDSGIVDLWTYFYNPYVYIRDLIVDDLPTMAGVTYTITITGPGTVGIGLIRIGRGKFIGEAQYGSGVGTTRYSQPLFDKYGNYTPSQRRASAKRGSFDMHISADLVDDVKYFLDNLDISLVVFNMTAEYTRGKIWGFVKNADFTWFDYGVDKYRLEIEGAT